MTPSIHPHPDDRRLDPPPPCQHPPARRYAWIARDDTAPDGAVLVIACCDCGAVLQGASELDAAGAA